MGETADTAAPEPLNDRRDQESFDHARVGLAEKDDSAIGPVIEGLRGSGLRPLRRHFCEHAKTLIQRAATARVMDARRGLRAYHLNEIFGLFREVRPEGVGMGHSTGRPTVEFGFGGLFKGLGSFNDLSGETIEKGEKQVARRGEFRVKGLGEKARGVYGVSVRMGIGGMP